MMPRFMEGFMWAPCVKAKPCGREVEVRIGDHVSLVGSVETLLEMAAEIRDQVHLVEMDQMMREQQS